jgi:2-polyprenyl-3-methyl-5-hydroxy-6-metoxy-1,4-benzoquinol methylase
MKKPAKINHLCRQAVKFGWGKNNRLGEERKNLILKHVEGKKIIDIGCGTGLWTDFLTKKGFDVVGVDKEEFFIQQAKKTKKGQFICASAERLPYQSRQFDTALLINLLEHTDNDLEVLKNIAKTTRKKIIINVPQKTAKNLSDKGVVYKHHLDTSHKRTYSQKSLKELINKSGLKLSFLKPVEPLPSKWLTYELIESRSILKKAAIAILFAFLKPKKYYLELFAVAKIK